MKLLTIENIKLIDKNNNIKFEQNNIKNTLHQLGQFYMLNVLFANKTLRVDDYWAGLDSRRSLSPTDIMSSLVNEPTTNGYNRQKITSWTSPVLVNSVYAVKSNKIIFNALSGTSGWGPVRNIFLTTQQNNNGYLISSVRLNQELSVVAGDSIILSMNLSLSN